MLVLHGTTKELSFLVNEFKKSSCWGCSLHDNYVYVWNPASFESEFQESYSEPPWYNFTPDSDVLSVAECFRYAKDSAYTQAAHLGKDTQCMVYVLDIPQEYLEPDTSCPNMENALRFRKTDFDPSWIVGLYTKDFSSYASPFLVANLLRNEYFEDSLMDENLYKIAKSLFNAPQTLESVYCDLVDELQEDWELSPMYPVNNCYNIVQKNSSLEDMDF